MVSHSRDFSDYRVDQAEAKTSQKGQRKAGVVLTAGSKGMARTVNEGPPAGIQSPSFCGMTLARIQPLMSATEFADMW